MTATPAESTLTGVPADIKALRQWLVWRYVKRNGGATKVPFQADGKPASTTDQATWASYEDAETAYSTSSKRWNGLGFVFSPDDPYCGVDLDNCIEAAGELKGWAQTIIATFADTYMEVSPSGQGIKIWCKARLPGAGRSKKNDAGEGIEIYDRGRYFTVTGNVWNGAPSTIQDHQKDVEKLYELVAGSKPGKTQPIDGRILHGTQHNTLVSLAGSMRRRGMGVEAIFAALWETNNRQCELPGSEEDIRRIARSACRNWPPDPNATAFPDGAPVADWRDHLIRSGGTKDKSGGPARILANAITALRLAPAWNGVLGFNEFSFGTVALKPTPWAGAATGAEWTDHEDRLTTDWLQHQGIFVSVDITGQAVQSVARDRCFHPVREYLDSIRWDETRRIDTWLSLYLGAETNDYTAAVGERWLISAVARIFEPGAKVDCCMILEGPQGMKKSTALKTIAGEWFTDEMADLGSKDSAMQTRGTWIIELAELDSISRGDVGRIKSFMSRTTDRFRPPYGKRLIESPRQCVFAGSVNHSTYLRDETGGRRFWPVACTGIMIDALARDRNQLWAEAVVRYRSGARWWLDSMQLNQLAEREQSDRYEGDPWDELIAPWVEHPSERHDGTGHPSTPFTSDRDSVTVADVLTHCIGKRPDQWFQSDKNRVARCLSRLGWERYQVRTGGNRIWRYRRMK